MKLLSRITARLLFLFSFGLSLAHASPFSKAELAQVQDHLFANIATEEQIFTKQDEGREFHSLPGAMLASPSNKGKGFSQDYQFHWTRDAAITMQEVAYLYGRAEGEEKRRFREYLINYINFEKTAQKQPSRAGEHTLGQPKFNIDATVWEGEWGRPQNDGPALRAITLISIANLFIGEGEEKQVREILLEMVATDLDYLQKEWKKENFGLWEEVKDVDHFFNKMVQRKSFIDGAALFKKTGDNFRAANYQRIANEITLSLERHWHDSLGYFAETVNQQYYRGGGLNSAILLGALYGNLRQPHDPFALDNDRMMSTIFYLRNQFSGLYQVNLNAADKAPLLGRYTNDVYDGNKFLYGNPWILITNALGQYYYELAAIYRESGQIEVTTRNIHFFKQITTDLVEKTGVISAERHTQQFQKIIAGLIAEGDRFLEVVKAYGECYPDGSCLHFAEQIDRASGKPVSAKDLTWGYTTLLNAMQARSS